MQQQVDFEQVRQCPECQTWWRRDDRRWVGHVGDRPDDHCPDCQMT